MEPLTAIHALNIMKFFWENLVCHFSIPRELTVDNGKQFDSCLLCMYCEELGTKIRFASIYHPQSNRACEQANRLIFSALKKRIFGVKSGTWAEELLSIFWAHRTTTTRATGFSPFCLLFGEEAMSPKQANNLSLRVQMAADPDQEAVSMDHLEEAREKVVENLKRYPRETAAWRNMKTKPREFHNGILDIRRRRGAKDLGKFERKWEGSYIATT